MQFDSQQAYCTPVHYYNESFVLTKYPVDQREGEDSGNTAGASDLAVYIAITVISTLFVVAVAVLVWYKMKRRPSKEDGTWGEAEATRGCQRQFLSPPSRTVPRWGYTNFSVKIKTK